MAKFRDMETPEQAYLKSGHHATQRAAAIAKQTEADNARQQRERDYQREKEAKEQAQRQQPQDKPKKLGILWF